MNPLPLIALLAITTPATAATTTYRLHDIWPGAFGFRTDVPGSGTSYTFDNGAAMYMTHDATENTVAIFGSVLEWFGIGSYGDTFTSLSYSIQKVQPWRHVNMLETAGTGSGFLGNTELGAKANPGGAYFIFDDDGWYVPNNDTALVGRAWCGDLGEAGHNCDFLFQAEVHRGPIVIPQNPPAPVPLPNALLMFASGFLLLWHFGGRKM